MIATIPTSGILPEGIAATPGVETPPELFAALVSAIGTAVADVQAPGDGEVPISELPAQPAEASPASLPTQPSLPDFLGLLLAETEVTGSQEVSGDAVVAEAAEVLDENAIAPSAGAAATIVALNSVPQAALPKTAADNAPDAVNSPAEAEGRISLPSMELPGIDAALRGPPATVEQLRAPQQAHPTPKFEPGLVASPSGVAEKEVKPAHKPELGTVTLALPLEKQAAEIRAAVSPAGALARVFAAEQSQGQAQERSEFLPLPILASLAPERRALSNETKAHPLGAPDIAAPNLPAALSAAFPLMASEPAAPSTGTLVPAEAIDPATLVVERELEVAQDGEWLDQLAKDISRAAGGEGGLLRFRLNPEHLGRLDVQVTQDRNGAAVRITADNEAARTILADAQPRLVAEARAQGLRISETHVDLGQQGSGDPRRQNAAEEEAPVRTARLLQEKEEGDGNPTPARSERYA